MTAIFRRIDLSGDECISFVEFEEAMRSVKLSKSSFELENKVNDMQIEEWFTGENRTISEIFTKWSNPIKTKINNFASNYCGGLNSYKSKCENEERNEHKLDKEFNKKCCQSVRLESDSPPKPRVINEPSVKSKHKKFLLELYKICNNYKTSTKANTDELSL